MMCLKYSSNRSNTLKILLNHFKNRLGLVRVLSSPFGLSQTQHPAIQNGKNASLL